MADIFTKSNVYTRAPLCDFILAEKASPNGWSRKVVAYKDADHKTLTIGALVDLDGKVATGAAVKGICLSDFATGGIAKGISTQGEAYVVILFRDAEVKKLDAWTAADITALAAVGIDVVATGA